MRGKDIFKVLVGFGIITILTWDGIANKYKEGVKILKNESYAVRKPFKKLYIWYVPLYIDSISYPDIKKRKELFKKTSLEVEDSLTLYFDTIDVLPYSLSEFCFAGLKKGKDINEIWEEIKKKGDGVLKIEHTVYYEKRKAFIEKLFGLEKKAINRFEIELFSFSEGHVVWERDFEIYFEDDFLWKPESIIVGLFDAIGKELQEEGYIKQTKPPWVEDIERTHRRKENRKEH